MLKRVLFAGLILGALTLSGCLFVRAPDTGVIEGYVTNHLSGEPVVGATVRAWPMDGEAPRYGVISDYYGPMAVTDANGFYRLTVPEGMYVVEARKEGHATSRVVGVKVASTACVDLV
ncbi:MAG: carboxypeptidase-like regulatory domain-containing protein [Candidatus Bipolaricaulaceae bacterium]